MIANFFILLVSVSCIFCEFYSAVDELSNLVKNDEKLIQELRQLIFQLENETFKIKKNFENFEKEHEIMKNDATRYVPNPLNAFLLIKRLSHDIDSIQKSVRKIADDFITNVEENKLPSNEISGVVEGIYRLQNIYDLKSQDLAKGIIYDKKYRKDLSVNDLVVLGREILQFDSHLSSEYLKLAQEQNEISMEMSQMELLEEIFEIYNTSKIMNNEAVEVLNKILEIDPSQSHYEAERLNLELSLLFDDVNVKNSNDDSSSLQGSHYTLTKEIMILKKACNGKLSKSAKEMSQLHSRYVSNTPFSKIAPFKVIEANLVPYVGIFLDVISDDEIKILKSIAQSKLIRAKIMTTNSSQAIASSRVAKLNWNLDSAHEVFKTLTQRVGDMSGLNMETSEQWQTQNYGIGGHYNLHFDFTVKGQQFNGEKGNRIATTLFYLNDVEIGGATVFPFLKIYVAPRKGSAVFWHNLSSSGDREYMTRHSACPVVIGSKWVANKWLREKGQEFARPCELKPFMTDDKYYLKHYSLSDYGIEI